MSHRHDADLVPAARIAAEEVLAERQELPDPLSLSLTDWLRRVPEYLEPLEVLGEAGLVYRPGDRVDAADLRIARALVRRLARLRECFEMVRDLADDRDAVGETFDPTRAPWRNWQTGHCFRVWRDGEHQVTRPNAARHREGYEAAIAKMRAFPQRFSTVDALVATYFGEGHKAPLQAACASSSPTGPIDREMVTNGGGRSEW